MIRSCWNSRDHATRGLSNAQGHPIQCKRGSHRLVPIQGDGGLGWLSHSGHLRPAGEGIAAVLAAGRQGYFIPVVIRSCWISRDHATRGLSNAQGHPIQCKRGSHRLVPIQGDGGRGSCPTQASPVQPVKL